MESKRKVSLLLAVGIIFMPVVFSWITLRQGYSTLARVVSVIWMVLVFMAAAAAPPAEKEAPKAEEPTSADNTELSQSTSEQEKLDNKNESVVLDAEKTKAVEPESTESGKVDISKQHWPELSEPAQDSEQADSQTQTSECVSDSCIADKYMFSAIMECQPEIQQYAQYDYEWTHGFFTPWAKKYKVDEQNRQLIHYFGDSLKFQNGFGAWQNMIFMCVYDAGKESVIEVAVEPGRL